MGGAMNRYILAGLTLAMLLGARLAVADDDTEDSDAPEASQSLVADDTTRLVADLTKDGPEAPAVSANASPAASVKAGKPVERPVTMVSPGQIKKVVCIGDCVTKGIWWSEEVGRGTCWVDQFAGREKGVQVVNAGRDALESKHFWYVKELLRENPDANAFILYMGLNDLRGVKDADPEVAARIAGRVGYMIDLIRQKSPSARVLVVSPQRVEPARLNQKWKDEAFGDHTAILGEFLNISLRKIALDKQALFVALSDTIDGNLLPDGVHPGVAGHAKIAETIYGALKETPVRNAQPVFAEAKKVAPPAQGRPYLNMSGTDAVVAGVRGDLLAMQGGAHKSQAPATTVSGAGAAERKAAAVAEGVQTGAARVSNFVCAEDRSSFVSDEAVKIGMAAGDFLSQTVAGELDWQEEAGVQTVYNHLEAMTGEANVVRIETPAPDAPQATSFITQIRLPDEAEYGILGSAVNWDSIASPEAIAQAAAVEVPVLAAVQAAGVQVPSLEEQSPLPQAPSKTEAEEVAYAKAAAQELRNMVRGAAAVEERRDAMVLPEAPEERPGEFLLPGGAVVPGIPVLGAFSARDAKQEDSGVNAAGAKGEEKPSFKPSLEPLSVPGYAVYVHTRPEKL